MQTLWHVIIALSLFFVFSGCGVVDQPSLSPAPLAADSLVVSPSSPSNDTTPTVSGATTASASIKLYDEPNCGGLLVGTGTSDSSGSFTIDSAELFDGYHSLSVLTTSHNSGVSVCSTSSLDYIVDTIAPIFSVGAPSASLVNSASPAVTYELDYITSATVNLQVSHVALNATGTATCQITITDGTTHNPIVNLSNCTGDGLIRLSITSGSAVDAAGNVAATSNARGVFTVDNSGVSTAVYNPDTGIFNSIPTSVSITFAETIDGTTVSAADFNVSGTCSLLPTLAVTNVINSTITISLTGANCALGETTTITTNLTGISDPVGNPGTGTAVATYTVDNIGPTSASFSPAAARFTTIPTTVIATFDEPVDPSSVSDADFVVTGTCTTLPILAVTNTLNSSTTFTLTGADCSLDQTVIITLNFSNITDVTNNPGVGSSSVTYTFDDVGPMAASINPVTSSVPAIPSSISVTFTENILATSLADTDLIVNGTCSTLPTVVLSSASTATATFTLANEVCSNGQTVIVTMNGNTITDDAGNSGTGSVSASYTFDDTGPVAASSSPTTSTVNAIPSTITFHFDEALLASSLDASDVSVGGTCSTLPTVTLMNVSGSMVVFGLAGATCATGENVTLAINGADVTDAATNPGGGSVNTTFTIDSTGPSPSSISPLTANYTTMPTSVSITFDESILASSVAASDLGISGSCSVLPTASVVSVTGSTVNFLLGAATCADGENLIINILGSDVADLSNNIGANNQIVTYTKDITGPSVSSFSPPSSTVISIPSSINITFDEPLSAISVTSADFIIGGTCNILPTLSVSTVVGQQVLLNLSGAVCAHDQTVLLTVDSTGINDAIGNAGLSTFDVTYTIDNAGPLVSSITPNSGSPPLAITVTFSENLNPTTVSLADFTLSGTCTTKSLNLTSVINNIVELELAGAVCASGETLIITTDAAGVVDSIGNVGSGTSFVSFIEP